MNKKYIDFVPTKKTAKKTEATRRRSLDVVARKPKSTVIYREETDVRQTMTREPEFVESVTEAEFESGFARGVDDGENFSLRGGVNFGMIEDYQPKFVRTEVPKRPLSVARQGTIEPEMPQANEMNQVVQAKEVKGRKIGGFRAKRVVEKPVEKSKNTEAKKAGGEVMPIPKTPFINQGRVEKRPLSKNVYQKKIKATEEKATGPVTIIAKPEKDKHISLVVTIIITIILGAAAGTVAFLLLPK